jgi:hypothetical protein
MHISTPTDPHRGEKIDGGGDEISTPLSLVCGRRPKKRSISRVFR